jgi:hypothetical protein
MLGKYILRRSHLVWNWWVCSIVPHVLIQDVPQAQAQAQALIASRATVIVVWAQALIADSRATVIIVWAWAPIADSRAVVWAWAFISGSRTVLIIVQVWSDWDISL